MYRIVKSSLLSLSGTLLPVLAAVIVVGYVESKADAPSTLRRYPSLIHVESHLATPLSPTYVSKSNCTHKWQIQVSPNSGNLDNSLQSVGAVTSSNIWAVGSYIVNNLSQHQTLIVHWNGTQWSIVPSPNLSADDALRAVSADTSNNVWAVGLTFGAARTLVEHWDGTQWSIVPSPNPSDNSSLENVAVVAPNDVWAVGHYLVGDAPYTLIEHWDGLQWSIIPSPDPGPHNILSGLTEISSTDLWAVGSYGMPNTEQPLTLHWDGSVWKVVPSPSLGTNSGLTAVSAISANDIWAVGTYSSAGTPAYTLIQHWDATRWSVVPSPNPSTEENLLLGVRAISADDVWAVGSYLDDQRLRQTLTVHWDGAQWRVVPSPNQDDVQNDLRGLAVDPQGNAGLILD